MDRPKRILAVRLSALGDLILAQPALLGLRRHLPDAEIVWLVDQRFTAIAAEVPGIRVIGIPKPRSPLDFLRLRRQLRSEPYDVLLAMQAALRVNLLYAGVRAPVRVGFDPRRARDLHRWFINRTIQRRDEHLLDGFAQFAAALGAAPADPQWPTWDATDHDSWWHGLGLRGPYVVVHTGASKPERCWPPYRYGELAARFCGNQTLDVVLTGGNSSVEHAAAVAFRTECPRAIDLTAKTSLGQLRLLLRRAAAVVSPDTAAVHLARVENVPVVGLYAVARPELSGPYQALAYTVNAYPEAVRRFARRDPAQVDWHFRVHHPDAMSLIEAPAVWTKLEQALADRAVRS